MTPNAKFAGLVLFCFPAGLFAILLIAFPKSEALGFGGMALWIWFVKSAIDAIRCPRCAKRVIQRHGVKPRLLEPWREPPGDTCPHCGFRWR